MAVEIERKFLVENDTWKMNIGCSIQIVQGYLVATKDVVTRIRIIDNEKSFLTIKAKGSGISRPEFEYEIPLSDGLEMLKLCEDRVISKVRHIIDAGNQLKFEVDEFSGRHTGLVLAEIELDYEDETFEIPSWLGDEVSTDERYFNATLAVKN